MARILVVDDEPLIAMLAEEWLDELGCVVVGPALTLAEAAALVEEPLDGAILDVSLGAETSDALAARLKELGVPYALATGRTGERLDPHAVAMLDKPFDFDGFRRVVEALLAAGR